MTSSPAVTPPAADERAQQRQTGDGDRETPPQAPPRHRRPPDDTERFDDDPPQRRLGDQRRGEQHATHDGSREERDGSHVRRRERQGGRHDGGHDAACHEEEDRADREAEGGADERLPRRDAARGRLVGTDEAERGEPAVARLAAVADGRAEEAGDGHEHHDEADETQEQHGRVGVDRCGGGAPERGGARGRPLGEPVRSGVEAELVRAEEALGADRADDRVPPPVPQDLTTRAVHEPREGRRHDDLAGGERSVDARREGCTRAVDLQEQALDPVLAEARADDVGERARRRSLALRGDDRARVRTCRTAVDHGREARDEQQHRDADTDARGDEREPRPPGTPAADAHAHAEREVGEHTAAAYPGSPAHAWTCSRTRPSRTTASRSE